MESSRSESRVLPRAAQGPRAHGMSRFAEETELGEPRPVGPGYPREGRVRVLGIRARDASQDHSSERRQRGELQFRDQGAAAGITGTACTRHHAEETELGEP